MFIPGHVKRKLLLPPLLRCVEHEIYVLFIAFFFFFFFFFFLLLFFFFIFLFLWPLSFILTLQCHVSVFAGFRSKFNTMRGTAAYLARVDSTVREMGFVYSFC